MKRLNMKREQLKLDVASAINRASLEHLVDMGDHVIAEVMVDSFVSLIKAKAHQTILNGNKETKKEAMLFIDNIGE